MRAEDFIHCRRGVGVLCILLAATTQPPLGADELDSTEHQTPSGEAAEKGPSPPQNQPYFIGEVVVSADDAPPPGANDSLDAETIDAAGVMTAAEALELLPGVSLSTTGRSEQKIWVRGYEQSNVLVLVDGVPMADPYYGDLDLGQLPIFDVARISVTRGGASPLYGPNGLGGVVNSVTFQGGGEGRIAGRFRFTDNRTGLIHGSAGGSDERVNWYVGLARESSDGWDLSSDFEATEYENGGTRVNSDFARTSALTRVGYRIDDRSSLLASIRLVDSEKGIPFHTTEPRGFVRFARFPTWRQTTAGLGYERRLRRGGELRAQVFGLGFENTLEVFDDPGLQSMALQSTFSDRTYGGYVVLGQVPLSERHRLGAALHLRNDRHEKTERYPDGPVDPSEEYAAWTYSVSVEDRWSLTEQTDLVASLALDSLQVEKARTLRGGGDEPQLTDDPRRDDVLLSPQVEIQAALGASWSASAAVYRRSRFPTMRQLYGTDPANPDLQPQRNAGVDLGIAWSGGPMFLRGNVFVDRVEDLISRQGRAFPYENQDEAEIRGVELRAGTSGRWFDLQLSWTGLHHEFTSSSEGMEQLPFVPDQQTELMGVAHLGPRFDLRGTWLACGSRVYYDFGEKKDLESYQLLDIGLIARVANVELSLQLENVFDENIEQEDGYPLPGRRLWAGARVTINP